MATAATTTLPSPLTIVAPVINDFANMTLIVKRPDAAGGYEKLLWRESHQALVKAEQRGWPNSTPFVWGSAPGNDRFAHAAPGPNLTLLFAFAVGTPAAKVYAELVSRPVYALVTADRSLRYFLGVSFRNRP